MNCTQKPSSCTDEHMMANRFQRLSKSPLRRCRAGDRQDVCYDITKLSKLVCEFIQANEQDEAEMIKLRSEAEKLDSELIHATCECERMEKSLANIKILLQNKETEAEKLQTRLTLYEDMYKKECSRSKQLSLELHEVTQKVRILEEYAKDVKQELAIMKSHMISLSEDVDARMRSRATKIMTSHSPAQFPNK